MQDRTLRLLPNYFNNWSFVLSGLYTVMVCTARTQQPTGPHNRQWKQDNCYSFVSQRVWWYPIVFHCPSLARPTSIAKNGWPVHLPFLDPPYPAYFAFKCLFLLLLLFSLFSSFSCPFFLFLHFLQLVPFFAAASRRYCLHKQRS